MSEFTEELAVYIRAGYPILSIVSGEEDRVLERIESLKNNPRVVIDLDDEGRDELIKACQGLTKAEAENALARTIVSRGRHHLHPEHPVRRSRPAGVSLLQTL